ncbi:MAG: sodium-dependent bicarbonate transport family permease [Alphaproteobacteria bacterium]|nr:sodium-dependent bicarbonate transport family permease [Alphaproteobacteria bacterium]|tara:strand:- start:398 stop:1378 length:981 start_codon:yes stop_codon:yes gene_type:complete
MDFFTIVEQNLFTPAIMFFALGVFAGLVKSDLSVPDSISKFLSLYLMMAIGFKGGVAIADTPEINNEVIFTALAGVAIGFVQPFLAYILLKFTTKLDKKTAAAVAAHYGSISMVTFATAATFLEANEIIYAGYIVAVLALMEAPAIMSGLFIARKGDVVQNRKGTRGLTHEIATNGAILLLLGAFGIGWASGEAGMNQVSGFISDPFQGILCLFLLDMGLLVARNLEHLKNFTFSLILFGIYMPLMGAAVGLGASFLIGLDIGTALLFTVLCASASYIAVPAAMRLALPEANPSIYVPMSLAVTFPFNIIVGIPLYYSAVQYLLVP